MLGPVIASGVREFLNYFWTLIFFAVLVFVLGIASALCIPKRLDQTAESQG